MPPTKKPVDQSSDTADGVIEDSFEYTSDAGVTITLPIYQLLTEHYMEFLDMEGWQQNLSVIKWFVTNADERAKIGKLTMRETDRMCTAWSKHINGLSLGE